MAFRCKSPEVSFAHRVQQNFQRPNQRKAGLDQPGKKYVGVGFWAEGIDTTPADSGQLQMENRRLLLAQLIADGIVKVEEK